jgi:DNA-binding MarR family transcriptional regulator
MSTKAPVDFGILLNVAFGVFKTGLHEHLAEAGFEDIGRSYGYVFRLLEPAPLNLQAVASLLEITPQGALKLINDMVAKGYVARRDDLNDGRVKQLVLTPRALKAMAVARRFHAKFESDLADRIGARRVAAMRLALEDIVSQHGSEGPPQLRPLYL